MNKPKVTFENKLDIKRLENALSMILSNKYGCDIKVKMVKKEECKRENPDTEQQKPATTTGHPDGQPHG